ncbi:hypothetical protein BC938DRAFT_475519 [Jimgerdemannia flammicorona]|uniref:Uncharacterized protein n=1 Tax=Jimgerdemannia flammicorona TaxID=994334 RepID=A0A433PT48_9FUNG|nr:hypothetical protein BC938DRAFT_475519 [Jimgerdemannia flammicorona]
MALLHNLLYIFRRLGIGEHATQLYLDAAKAGDYLSQKELACRYQVDIGVPMNDDIAFHWLCQFGVSEHAGFSELQYYGDKETKSCSSPK